MKRKIPAIGRNILGIARPEKLRKLIVPRPISTAIFLNFWDFCLICLVLTIIHTIIFKLSPSIYLRFML